MSEEIHKSLITKLLQGDITEEESKQLDNLMATDDNAKAYFEKMTKLYGITELQQEFDKKHNIDKSFQSFLNIREDEPNVIPITQGNPMLKTMMRVAAAVLIALGAGYFYFGEKGQSEITAVNEGGHSSEVLASNDLLTIDTYQKEKTEKNLADKSKVALNINSKLTYPKTFEREKRIVMLEGEAFFHIEPDSTKPFEIHVGNATIVGTAFNVNANDPDSIVVTVKKGVVLFYNEKNPNGILLEANKKGTLLSEFEPVKDLNDNDNYLYWYDGTFWFKNTELKNVVSILNRELGINISIANKGLDNCRITATLKNKSNEEILELLEIVLDINVVKDNNNYVLSGEGC